jgi:hypothetical protein
MNLYLMAFILTGIGQILAWTYDVMQRDRKSKCSPEEFSFRFWLHDNKIQIPTSIIMAVLITLAVVMTGADVYIASYFSESSTMFIKGFMHLCIGISPAAFFTWIKRTSRNTFLQPDTISFNNGKKVFKRKKNQKV